jgi:hypothetical protein
MQEKLENRGKKVGLGEKKKAMMCEQTLRSILRKLSLSKTQTSTFFDKV